ncbi:MAG: hypothetical protein AB7P02_31535 [Alphaproteobacteria bacterium]
MPRLVVLDPVLDRVVGHPHAFAAALPAAAAARGLETRLHGGTQVPADFARRWDVTPLFRPSPRRRNAPGPVNGTLVAGPLLRLIDDLRQMVEDLHSPAAPAVAADDLVLLPTATPAAMIAVAEWLASLAPATRPRVAATIHEAADIFLGRPPGLTFEAMAWRAAGVALLNVLGERLVRLTATTDTLADALGRSTDLPVTAVPVANPIGLYACDIPADRRSDAEGRTTVALLGMPRIDKGNSELVPAIAAAIAAAVPGAWLLVQARSDFDRRRDLPASGALARANIHPGPLPEDVYVLALRSTAVMVVPYDPRFYRARVSGIFVDAAGAGCVTVVPAGTWMAERIAAGEAAGVVFEKLSPDAVAAATAEAVRLLPTLAPVALRCAAHWLRSVGPGPYLDAVLASFAAPPVPRR